MKKIYLNGAALAGRPLLTGCGGGNDDYYPPDDGATTLFLLDQNGNSFGGIPYICDNMTAWSATAYNGEFTFYPYEDCKFDFLGLNGNYFNDPTSDDIIRITDDLNRGKKDIPYDCQSFGPGTTYLDGSFEYDVDDVCTFHF